MPKPKYRRPPFPWTKTTIFQDISRLAMESTTNTNRHHRAHRKKKKKLNSQGSSAASWSGTRSPGASPSVCRAWALVGTFGASGFVKRPQAFGAIFFGTGIRPFEHGGHGVLGCIVWGKKQSPEKTAFFHNYCFFRSQVDLLGARFWIPQM